MNINNKRIVGIICGIILLIILISLYREKTSNKQIVTPILGIQATTTIETDTTSSATGAVTKPGTPAPIVNTKGFNSYANSQYNFTIKYPTYVQSKNTFSTFHELGTNWRLYAGPANQGKQILELTIHNIDQGGYSDGKQTYPLFFTAKVRIGTSANIKDCYATDSDNPNQKISNAIINGTQWKKFSTSDTSTMKYVQVESYRTIRNNTCFAVEKIKNGSTYRDDKMAMGTTEAVLTNYHNVGETIIKTFTFTK